MLDRDETSSCSVYHMYMLPLKNAAAVECNSKKGGNYHNKLASRIGTIKLAQ